LIAASLAEEGTPVIHESVTEHALHSIGSGNRLPIILKQISSDELLKLSVEELSSKCGYSRRHLNRIFREHFGQSVMGVKIKLRLDKAANLLRNPKAKVINVALECGFSHLGMFSSRFKQHFGLSPARWREDQFKGSDSPEPLVVIRPQPIKPTDGNANGKTSHMKGRNGRVFIPKSSRYKLSK
jgi:AraC-like DNA-binding protein